jgi:AraC-like DNA-binding protein
VALFWEYDSYGTHPRERVLPGATSELVIVLDGAPAGSVFCGAHSRSFEIGTASRPSLLGVHFKPGGAFPFLRKMPADELHNRRVSLDTIWGAGARALHDRLADARTPAARFRILERALLAQLTAPAGRHPAVTFALDAIETGPHAHTIGEITDRVGLSPRRFIELFTAQVGLTPKLFCRVRRFQEVLALIERTRDVDWADVALSCGYYDQAHFVHDFRAFAGITPTAYVRAGARSRNHVPLGESGHG